VKLVWSDVSNLVAETWSEVLGPSGFDGDVGLRRLTVRQVSIAGGTTQVNKNIVAQRVLGMPRGL
jgi:alkylation response protein AidB-like acyl-CoA dehydrogenase